MAGLYSLLVTRYSFFLDVTIAHLLQDARSRIPTKDAELLLAHVLETTRERLLAYGETALSPLALTTWQTLLERAQSGEPIAYLTGTAHFFGLPFFVSPDVLIPRPETELLVEAALRHIVANESLLRVVDVGTGSGCMLIAIARTAKERLLHVPECIGIDLSERALDVARRNALRHDILNDVSLLHGNLLEPIEQKQTPTLIVANLPYLPSSDARHPTLRHEPLLALDGGKDGLDLLTTLFDQLTHTPYPWTLLAEIDPRQKTTLENRLPYHFPHRRITITNDHAGHARVLIVE